ncbi:MAG: Eco57I restriction-modification methylase domain-containing protein, partial [Actinomycetota bacterium]
EWASTPIHLLGARVRLDRRTAGVVGASRSSPHALMQELVNHSEERLWGFVSNGLRLRILRDNVSLTRQAYVQFDLEAMMSGEVYADFVVLWLLAHQSRVEGDRPEDCWLERWSAEAGTQGARALEQLRAGVEVAITALGRGFLAHRANEALRLELRTGTLGTQEYYRHLLRLVYRLLFLFVAEDRGLLLHAGAEESSKDRYERYYSLDRLRRLAERRRGSKHHDLYRSLVVVMDALGADEGCPALGLPALGSFLWSRSSVAALAGCDIANRDLLEAVRALAFIEDAKVLRAVDYRNLGSEELGSIYESLLELHPDLSVNAGAFTLATAGGHERKTTGSYYTPTSLITELLNSALDPLLNEAASSANPESALLGLKIVDPACGSGHFLIAAAHRVAKRLAAARTGDEEPSPKAVRTALRDVIGRCIYGVDVNEMAVELCKVSLWMEALEPGRPLSFLDHRIACGNSLLGATPALLAAGIPDSAFKPIEGDDKKVASEIRARNARGRAGQGTFDLTFGASALHEPLAAGVADIDALGDASIATVREKEERYAALLASPEAAQAKLAADAWCAAFVARKARGAPEPVTEGLLWRLRSDPEGVGPEATAEIERLAGRYRFLHWHLAFSDVFRLPTGDEEPTNPGMGWSGGFDLVLGNPPWERVKLQEKEWFAVRRPDIAAAPNAAARRRLITALADDDPPLHVAFLDARRQAEGESHLVRDSARYPLCGRGDINTYAIFAEAMRSVMAPTGRAGVIVPSGIATDDTTKHFFADLVESRSLVSLYDFENRQGLFPDVDSRMKFCLLTLSGLGRPVEGGAEFVFFAHSTADLRDEERRFRLSAADLALLNPNTRTCPVFRSRRDAELTKTVYRRVPVLVAEGPPERNPWGVSFMRMFDMSNDSALFRTRAEFETEGWTLEGNTFRRGTEIYLPLYEGRMGHQFSHRFATQPLGLLSEVSLQELRDPNFRVQPEYWVNQSEALRRLARRELGCKTGLLGHRRVARNTDERTVIATVVPWGPASYGWILTLGPSAADLLFLATAYNSFAFDYLLRNAVSQPSIPQGTFEQIACPVPAKVETGGLADLAIPRALELTYTAWD